MNEAFISRPVGRLLTLLTGITLALVPIQLYWDWIANPLLKGDDFAFLADSRCGQEPFQNLWRPHNTHVVPLFRLMTSALCRLAGPIGNVPVVLNSANVATLVLLLILVGHFVAWETGRMGFGFVAMALLGLSTVVQPSATWYSAGQTLCTGLLVMATLLSAQAAMLSGRRAWLVPALLAAGAAPLLWTGGLCAGVAGTIYLMTHRTRLEARWALVPLAGTALGLIILVIAAGPAFLGAIGASPPDALASGFSPLRIVTHTTQAIVESIVVGNLGLTTLTFPLQSAILVLGLAAVWFATRRERQPLPNVLEAVGLSLICIPYGMAFALRSGVPYDNLREMGWYDTLPQLGFVLFATGWTSSTGNILKRPRPLTRLGWLAVVITAFVLLLLHVPRARQMRTEEAPPLTPSEKLRFPIPELQYLRSIYYASERSERQRRALQRLAHASALANRSGVSREGLRANFGRVLIPAWPLAIEDQDALDLVPLPTSGPVPSRERLHAIFAPLLAYEPSPRPPWLDPEETWPPDRGGSVP